MFTRKPRNPDETSTTKPPERKKRNWLKISLIANAVLLIAVGAYAATAAVVHQSDTNPNFCASCHVMQSKVTSYYTSGNLDNAHAAAGVMCKDCHDYPLDAEIAAGVNYVTGNYVRDENGELPQRDFGDEICTQCHISLEHVALSTDFLFRNPHGTEMGVFTCNTCHISHGEQIDYCSECHDNGGQRMIGDTTPRSELIGIPADMRWMFDQ
ncbi:MAG: cytochrome c3 family protein [Anaerolineae bacterium]|nr:cytochrome c3 family protein [Anaerolineae bacterium]